MKDTKIYKYVNNCAINADIYFKGKCSPIIIYIHSGALIFGTRTWLPSEQIDYFFQAGYSIVNIDYRLAPETKFEQIIEDIKDAIEWVRTKATEWYDFDTTRIAIIGGSAGAYLSLLLGTMDFKPKAIISFYGYGDILGDWYSNPSEHYCQRPIVSKQNAYQYVGDREITNGQWDRINFYVYCRQYGVWIQEVTGYDQIKDRNKLVQFNPIDNITIDYPPTLFLHGDQDTDVPYEQSVIMYNKLKKIGIETKLITIEGADHVFDQNFQDPRVQNAFKIVIDFLNTHLCK